MVKITVENGPKPERRRRTIAPISIADIQQGDLQEGQTLDFKREVNLDLEKHKLSLIDDVVAFLNRGSSQILVGVEEKGGKFDSFRPLIGDPDKTALRFQSFIQANIVPLPIDIQVVPVSLKGGFILDIQIPAHIGGPFMSRLTGGYRIRSGSANLPMEPSQLRSRFIDEREWMRTLDALASAEDERLGETGQVVLERALRIAILPAEHFDHLQEPFAQEDYLRRPAPSFTEHGRPFFKLCEEGHQALSPDGSGRCIERLFVRDDWFIHAVAALAIHVTSGEGRLALHEFNRDLERYLGELSAFLADEGLEGPFAVTLAVQNLEEHYFRVWFRDNRTVRMMRPKLVATLDDADLIAEFQRRVRQASGAA